MCGICGQLSWSPPPDSSQLELMTARLEHRGPDDSGIYLNKSIGLGHRRLAVIDPSADGRQPMAHAASQSVVSFNGEIYNYRELRRELAADGVEFRTNTDTEVLLAAFAHWGNETITRLDGMFAFALWNEQRQELPLARDRLGEKPLYYAWLADGGIAFASELSALLCRDDTQAKLNIQALDKYLSINYSLGPESMVAGIQRLEPASYLVVRGPNDSTEHLYWNLAKHFEQTNKSKQTLADAEEELRALLCKSVDSQLVSDVPLGAFLSGGIDSACIVAAMRESASKVKSFTAGFDESSYSEIPQAAATAKALLLDHKEQLVSMDSDAALRDIVTKAGEPFADTSIIPLYYLAEFVRRHVTVALGGDGSDEIFAGYDTYLADKINRSLCTFPGQKVSQTLVGLAARFLPVSHSKVSLDYKLRRFAAGLNPDPVSAHYAWRVTATEQQKNQLLRKQFRLNQKQASALGFFQQKASEVPNAHYLDKMMYLDIKTWFADDILVKLDRATMAHSLEARLPFVSHRLVEFAARQPVSFKIAGAQRKRLLRRSQQSLLPKSVLTRKKSGFNAPVAHWFADPQHALSKSYQNISEILSSVFEYTALQELHDEHVQRKNDNSLVLFALLVLGIWMDQYNVVAEPL